MFKFLDKKFLLLVSILILAISVIAIVFLPTTSKAYTFTTPLDLGNHGSNVSALQQTLKDLKFFNYPEITGYFGFITQAAVQAFQVATNIVLSGTPQTTGFGRVGPKTLAVLNAQTISTSTSSQQISTTTITSNSSNISTNIGTIKSPWSLSASPDYGKIYLSWNAVEGATSYNVKRKLLGGDYDFSASSPTNNYTDTAVTEDKTYIYTITTVSQDLESQSSQEVTASAERRRVGGGSTEQTITLSHNWIATCADATTCAITATGGASAGNLLTIQAVSSNPVWVSSISAGGTAVDAKIRSGINLRRYLSGAYVLSADAVGDGNTITVTFSGTTGGVTVDVREYAVSGGTIALDAVGDLSTNTGVSSPITGIPLTLSGTSDAVVEWLSSHNGTVSAVSSPWTNTQFGSYFGFADQAGITSFTAPQWTETGATYTSRAAMAFGFSPTACTFDIMTDFGNGTDGTAPTAATLTTGTFGDTGRGNPAIVGGRSSYWTVTNASTYLLYNSAAKHTLGGSAQRLCNGGTTYADTALGGISLNTDSGANIRHIKWFPPYNAQDYGSPVIAASAWIKTTVADGETLNADVLSAAGATCAEGACYANAILRVSGGVLGYFLEGGIGSQVNVSSNTWYKVDVRYEVGSTAKMMIRNEAGVQVGTTQETATKTGGVPMNISIGDVNGAAKTAGKMIYWDKVRVCYIGTCPWPLPL